MWTLCLNHDVKAIVILSEDNEVNSLIDGCLHTTFVLVFVFVFFFGVFFVCVFFSINLIGFVYSISVIKIGNYILIRN